MGKIRYHISFKEDFLRVLLEEEGFSKKVLYWDTLKRIAETSDQISIEFLKKQALKSVRDLETFSFQQIDIPKSLAKEAILLFIQTKRLYYQGKALQEKKVDLIVKGKGDTFSCFLNEVGLETVDELFQGLSIGHGHLFHFSTSLSWVYLQQFRKGEIVLDGIRKKRFLEENIPILWQETTPKLCLTDQHGTFSRLEFWKSDLEKDLLEIGFQKKGENLFFLSSDKVREALLLLIDVGWEVQFFNGKKILRQTESEWRSKEKEVVEMATFSDREKKIDSDATWIEIDEQTVGLIDPKIIKKENLETPPSTLFKGALLAHQQKGLNWLSFIYKTGSGALLADEMGLGKTVQVLAFFSTLRTKLPILIVAPASLLFHWKNEVMKFLPHADSFLYLGPNRLLPSILENKYVIVSYTIMRQDIELFSKINWEVILLDESSAIKTKNTETAKAALELKAKFKIALNGTPIENRLEELLSQFQFLHPALSLKAKANPKCLKPFLLRRKKEELDLPEKIEQTIWVQMDEAQEKIYTQFADELKKDLLKKITVDGIQKHRMEVLEGILRLRQLAIDPRLFGFDLIGAKIERVLEDIEEILGEKRKVLIYSQFTSLLSLLKKELKAPFLYLDGTVSAEKREQLVQTFQQDENISLFLLSLKAGGVGLNLTRADYVLLLDPWWNEAVENQAIDRAHRIGRKDTVIGKRYLTLGTIEEKMAEIKAKKKQGADAILEGSDLPYLEEDDFLYLFS